VGQEYALSFVKFFGCHNFVLRLLAKVGGFPRRVSAAAKRAPLPFFFVNAHFLFTGPILHCFPCTPVLMTKSWGNCTFLAPETGLPTAGGF